MDTTSLLRIAFPLTIGLDLAAIGCSEPTREGWLYDHPDASFTDIPVEIRDAFVSETMPTDTRSDTSDGTPTDTSTCPCRERTETAPPSDADGFQYHFPNTSLVPGETTWIHIKTILPGIPTETQTAGATYLDVQVPACIDELKNTRGFIYPSTYRNLRITVDAGALTEGFTGRDGITLNPKALHFDPNHPTRYSSTRCQEPVLIHELTHFLAGEGFSRAINQTLARSGPPGWEDIGPLEEGRARYSEGLAQTVSYPAPAETLLDLTRIRAASTSLNDCAFERLPVCHGLGVDERVRCCIQNTEGLSLVLNVPQGATTGTMRASALLFNRGGIGDEQLFVKVRDGIHPEETENIQGISRTTGDYNFYYFNNFTYRQSPMGLGTFLFHPDPTSVMGDVFTQGTLLVFDGHVLSERHLICGDSSHHATHLLLLEGGRTLLLSDEREEVPYTNRTVALEFYDRGACFWDNLARTYGSEPFRRLMPILQAPFDPPTCTSVNLVGVVSETLGASETNIETSMNLFGLHPDSLHNIAVGPLCLP